jgi:anti-sigma factor RsiW
MCPDNELLSAYFDGEVRSPWKERIERHIASCLSCAATIDGYGRIRTAIASCEAGDDAFVEAKERVIRAVSGGAFPRRLRAGVFNWDRAIALPYPAAAGLAVAFMALIAALTITSLRPAASIPVIASSEKTKTAPVTVQLTDMQAVIDYLESQDNALMIVLPDSSRFEVQGNPQLLKASDYRRSVGH